MSEYNSLELEERDGVVLLPVKAKPSASRNALAGVFCGQLKVAVTAAPEKGKANKAIIKFLSKTLGISQKHIRITSGETSPEKKFVIDSYSLAEIRERILNSCS